MKNLIYVGLLFLAGLSLAGLNWYVRQPKEQDVQPAPIEKPVEKVPALLFKAQPKLPDVPPLPPLESREPRFNWGHKIKGWGGQTQEPKEDSKPLLPKPIMTFSKGSR